MFGFGKQKFKKVEASPLLTKKSIKLTDNLRDACLPKMLCEMAAKSAYQLNDKEKSLLELIRFVFV